MNVKIGTEAAQFPEKEYINENFLVVWETSALKRAWHATFEFRFFHETVSPGHLSIPQGPLRMLTKIRGDISNLVFITGANEHLFTKYEKINIKILLDYRRCIWGRW